MPRMTDEEADALSEEVLKNPPPKSPCKKPQKPAKISIEKSPPKSHCKTPQKPAKMKHG